MGAGEAKPRRPVRPRARLAIETLEDRCLLNGGPVISGFVYDDANNNGIFDVGEKPIANSTLQLWNSAGQVVSSAISDANGFYQFAIDKLISIAPKTLTHHMTFGELATDWSLTKSVPKFDPKLGALTAVEIKNTDPMITSTIKVENLDTSPATIKAGVSGKLTLTGPGVAGLVTTLLATGQTFNAGAFDGVIDFAGTSGIDFGPRTAHGANQITLTSAAQLALYLGSGTVSFTETTQATSSASGSANLLVSIKTVASAEVDVIYHYIPSNALKPGTYTIVQPAQPAGYFDNLETRGKVTVLPGSVGTDTITVNLGTTDLTHNNFGEILPAKLGGVVYVDANNDGVRSFGEIGIANVRVQLSGTDDLGNAVSLTRLTGPGGPYVFNGLRPGSYTITEKQPIGFLDGKESAGNGVGILSNDAFSGIVLAPGDQGSDYNFGELRGAKLSGWVYVDRNNNGVRNYLEVGIAGVRLALTGTDDLGNSVSLTTRTAANGFYCFRGLRPGTYTITETQPAAFQDGLEQTGNSGGVALNDQIVNILLGPGFTGANYNFGERRSVSKKTFLAR